MRPILLAVAVLTQVGCSPVVPTPTPTATPAPTAPNATSAPDFVRPFSDGDGRAWRILLYDPAGLLADVQQVQGTGYKNGDIQWDPIVGSPDSLVLAWVGGVCTSDRTLTVGMQGSHVSLTVLEDHWRPLAPNEACPGVGKFYWLRLTFRQPIAGFDISVAYFGVPQ